MQAKLDQVTSQRDRRFALEIAGLAVKYCQDGCCDMVCIDIGRMRQWLANIPIESLQRTCQARL